MKLTIKRKNKGFTLLEIIIVVIIVGVLASLALPRLFSTVEFSRSTEAFAAIGAIRSSMERCVLKNGSGNYDTCNSMGSGGELDVDPSVEAGTHFTYAVSAATTTGYTITASRNTLDGGASGDTVRIVVNTSAGTITKSGGGAFSKL